MMMMMSSGMMSCSVFLIIAVIVIWQWPKISNALNGGGGSPTGPQVPLPSGAKSEATWSGNLPGGNMVSLMCPQGKYVSKIGANYHHNKNPVLRGVTFTCNDSAATSQGWESTCCGQGFPSVEWTNSNGFGGANILVNNNFKNPSGGALSGLEFYDTSNTPVQYAQSWAKGVKSGDTGINSFNQVFGSANDSQVSGWPFYCPSGQKLVGMSYNHDDTILTSMAMFCG